MHLTLEVTAVSGQPPQTPLRLQLREGSRLLGRNPDNDLVLEDPERMVSGLHARVEAGGIAFVLIDLSTNGTYLNDAPDPLPRNQPTPLQDGDMLQIGPYDIAVAVAEDTEPDTAELPAEEPPPPPVPGFATHMYAPSADAPAEAAPEPSQPNLDFFTEPSPGRALHAEPHAADDLLPGLEQPGAGADILDLLGGGDQPSDGRLLEQAADPFAERPGVDDLLADPDAGREATATPTPVDQVFFQPPSSTHGDEPIPDDYDLLGDIEPPPASAGASGFDADVTRPSEPLATPQPPAQEPPAAPTTDARTEPVPFADRVPEREPSDWSGGGSPATPEPPEPERRPTRPKPAPSRPAATAPAPIEHPPAAAADGFAAAGTAMPDAAAETAAHAAPPGATPPLRPEPGRRATPPAASHAPTTAAGQTALDAFLAGLGTGDASQVADPDAFLRGAGALLRTLVAGLSTTLMVRTQFKSEMRLGVTTIRAAENNPLKFSVSVEDALERLLLRETHGFMPAQEAAKQGFEDILAHEMAMIAGLRSALDELLGRFAPDALAAELDDKSLDKVLPMAKKARCWDLLGERHAKIRAAASEDFMKVFGDAFSRAYDEQVALLARARRERGH